MKNSCSLCLTVCPSIGDKGSPILLPQKIRGRSNDRRWIRQKCQYGESLDRHLSDRPGGGVRENPMTIARTRGPALRSVRPARQPLAQIAPDAWRARREDSCKHDRDRRENHDLGRAVASIRTDAEQPLDPIHVAPSPFQTAQQALANILSTTKDYKSLAGTAWREEETRHAHDPWVTRATATTAS